MPTGMLNPVYDVESERLKEQLALANGLRQKGLEGNTGSGYQGGRVFIVGNPISNIVSGIAGQYMADKAREGQSDMANRQQQEFDTFMANRPGMYETEAQTYDPVSNPGTGPLRPEVRTLKSAAQMLEDQQKWIGQSGGNNPLIQSVRQQMMLKGLDWPEKMMAVESQQQAARDKAAIEAAARAEEQQWRRQFLTGQQDSLNAYREGVLQNQRDKMNQPTPADQKRQDALVAKEEAAGRAGSLLDQMATNIDFLDQQGGITNTKRSGGSNILSSIRNSVVGQFAGSALGTKEQAARNDIENIATDLLTELKGLKGLGASQMNSNMELQRYLLAIKGGKNFDADTMRNVIERARNLFGAAKTSSAGGERPTGGMPAGVTAVRTGTRADGTKVIQGSDGKVYNAQ